jgi:[ribosomal protein S18]-alanine N-acetyltransferase
VPPSEGTPCYQAVHCDHWDRGPGTWDNRRHRVVTIQRLRWWHIDEVARIEADLFGEEKWSPGMFWNELASGHHYVAALDGPDLAGYAGMALNPPDEAWVNTIAVRRDKQHVGVGRALLDDLLAYARGQGIRQTLLEVAANNAPAQRLYDAYGFDVIGVRRGYYQPSNTDALVMRREERP